jgi:hypothetical protein
VGKAALGCPESNRRSCPDALRATIAVLVIFLAILPSSAQQPLATNASASPVITFTLDFPQSNPPHYSITVAGDGHARYECTCSIDADSNPEDYQSEFEISPANRARIFDWAKQAKFFTGKVDSGNHKLAFTGAKELSYTDGQRSTTARYNYSGLEPVQKLTALFQQIAVTQDYGRRLAHFHHYQKLALDEELNRMEAQAKNDELAEIQSIEPVLRAIVDDNSVINVVRARAKELMETGGKTR